MPVKTAKKLETRGRKALPPEERRGTWLKIRVRPDELAGWRVAAQQAGVTLAEWVRGILARRSR